MAYTVVMTPRRISLAASIAASSLMAVVLIAPVAAMSVSPQTTRNVDIDLLVDTVKRKDYSAIQLARKIGARAIPELSMLATYSSTAPDSDSGVRELAVQCAAAIEGAEAEAVLVQGLLDPEQSVRIAAYQVLSKKRLSQSSLSPLISAFEASKDLQVRKYTVLAIGRIKGADSAALAPLCRSERDHEVQEACVVAMAGLGDVTARAEFLMRLSRTAAGRPGQPAPPERKAYLEHAEYLHANWLLRGLLPLLDDHSQAVRIGVDGVSMNPEYLRVCDVAVNLAASISQHPFSFAVDGRTNYAQKAIDEVRRYLLLN